MSLFSIPYDACCPTVKDQITSRTCNVCKLYFPSVVMVTQHKKELHPLVKVNDIPRTRPVRIAARRQLELMAIIAERMSEDAEWIDEEYVDIFGLQLCLCPEATLSSGFPTVEGSSLLWE